MSALVRSTSSLLSGVTLLSPSACGCSYGRETEAQRGGVTCTRSQAGTWQAGIQMQALAVKSAPPPAGHGCEGLPRKLGASLPAENSAAPLPSRPPWQGSGSGCGLGCGPGSGPLCPPWRWSGVRLRSPEPQSPSPAWVGAGGDSHVWALLHAQPHPGSAAGSGVPNTLEVFLLMPSRDRGNCSTEQRMHSQQAAQPCLPDPCTACCLHLCLLPALCSTHICLLLQEVLSLWGNWKTCVTFQALADNRTHKPSENRTGF